MSWAEHVALHGREEVYTGIWWGNLRERDHLEYPGVDGRKISYWISKKWDGGMDWITLDQDRDMWRSVVNPATNLRVP
jgi:hypothetical protein